LSGLRQAALGYREDAISGLLETLVHQDFLRRGYVVSVGKLGTREIDFVAERGRERLYLQVAYLMPTPQTRQREFQPLEEIPDDHPKLVLSLDPVPVEHPGGPFGRKPGTRSPKRYVPRAKPGQGWPLFLESVQICTILASGPVRFATVFPSDTGNDPHRRGATPWPIK
jgi:hypothetical protein